MTPFTRSISLRSRIYLGAGLLLVVCCVASVIGWFGQSALLSNIAEYEQAELVALQVLEIDRAVQELKARSETYIHSGSESTRRAADGLLEDLDARIHQTRKLSDSDEFTDLLDQMTAHLANFGDRLKMAAEERSLRTSLVDQLLPQQAERVRLALDELQQSQVSPSTESSAAILAVVQSFNEGREYLLRYLMDPGHGQPDEMLAAMRNAVDQAGAIPIGDSRSLEQRRAALSQALAEFQHLSLRAVQATRGYLYYSNVVMAGEISEFVYYSRLVKQFVNARQQRNRTARTAAVARSRSLSVIASLTAMIVAGLLATGLSTSILRPISRLTDAFRRLASGETLSDIPGADRSDELGRMSRAAQVFSAKNRETRDLLLRSQSLSAELVEKAQALEETNLELDNFAYVASHDLKAPLRGIKSLADWVREDCEELLPDDSKRHLTQMHDRVEKMETLLAELLEYSRVGRTEPHWDQVDLNDVVQSIIDLTDGHPGAIRVVAPLPKVRTAVTPLKQVLLNLITNAIKYNDKGDEASIEVSAEDLGDRLRISVADNGIGIDPRHHERAFQMYQRIAPGNVEGSGMGLAIVKKQVEYHGGSISVKSQEGQGATFVFTWPKVEQVEPSVVEQAEIH